ncbi:MAG: YggS family pyridoxal phosphate-dependent enzyme, partial [Christensenellaceae bacterium]|nr:YggS family pyridoxal phosphate-dependent enzyme [Christensenellaceae bacterium]
MNDEILSYSKERLHELKQNIEEVKEGLEIAAANAGRKASEILLLAVSKTMPTSDIAAAMALGMKDFAESRPQELMRKFDEISDENIHFHLIGQLQKNKVKYI